MGDSAEIVQDAGMKLSVSDRALIQDDFRMIFSLEGDVLPHIADLFAVFEVTPEHVDLFMEYYGSQILRLDAFGTVESGFGQNLAYAKLARINPVKFDGSLFTIIEPSELLLSDVRRFKRRFTLIKSAPQIEDCFVSDDLVFEAETYMFTNERYKKETQGRVSQSFLERAAVYKNT